MYHLFFRATNLLILLYPLLLLKSMTYSLAIRFFSQSLVMRYSALNNVPHPRYLIEFCYLYIGKCNNITNNPKKQNSGKKRLVQSYKSLKQNMVTKLTKKGLISKIKVTRDIFVIRGILRTVKYSNVGRYLDPCQTL